jgi:hypothetical protein
MARAPQRAAVVLALVVGCLTVVEAMTVRVTPVLADDTVMATFAAPAVFSPEVREAVQSGLPVTFTFVAELRRTSVMWFDPTLASTEVSSTVKFDTLTSTYQVSKRRGEQVLWAEQTPKEDDMRLWVTGFERVPLGATAAMSEQGEYYIRVRVRDSLPRGLSLWPFGRGEVSGRAEVAPGR